MGPSRDAHPQGSSLDSSLFIQVHFNRPLAGLAQPLSPASPCCKGSPLNTHRGPVPPSLESVTSRNDGTPFPHKEPLGGSGPWAPGFISMLHPLPSLWPRAYTPVSWQVLLPRGACPSPAHRRANPSSFSQGRRGPAACPALCHAVSLPYVRRQVLFSAPASWEIEPKS